MLPTDSDGALFTFFRSGDVIFRKSVSDMYNQNGWLGVSEDRRSFALNTSNGGAAGGWSITILRLDEKGSVRDLTNSLQTVEKDFSSRHFCKARGDNYEAMKWQKNDQLLISARCTEQATAERTWAIPRAMCWMSRPHESSRTTAKLTCSIYLTYAHTTYGSQAIRSHSLQI
jgi:hypothetical protein